MKPNRKKLNKGVVAIEAAIMLPIIIVITLAGLQYGWLFLKYQEITNVARHYVRYAVRPDSDWTTLKSNMITELGKHGISGTDIDTTGTTIAWATAETDVGDPVYAQVSIITENVDIINFFPIPQGHKLIAHAAMSMEGDD